MTDKKKRLLGIPTMDGFPTNYLAAALQPNSGATPMVGVPTAHLGLTLQAIARQAGAPATSQQLPVDKSAIPSPATKGTAKR